MGKRGQQEASKAWGKSFSSLSAFMEMKTELLLQETILSANICPAIP
jgi:hypothetical protein